MPRFLVQISVHLPADMAGEEKERLFARERQRGASLREAGVIEDIWRVPGRQANVGIWQAPTATHLHEAITSLPAWPWADVVLTPLADHPLTRQPEREA